MPKIVQQDMNANMKLSAKSTTTIRPASKNRSLNNASGRRSAAALHNFGSIPIHQSAPEAIQTKLTVNEPGDKYEKEADRVADKVMRMQAPQTADGQNSFGFGAEPQIQRKCAECANEDELQRMPEEEEDELQRMPEEDEEESLQAKEQSGTAPKVAPQTQRQIESLRNRGEPMAKATQGFFESRFGVDFSKVRIHANPNAAETASAINARAFTKGWDIVFASGQYDPESTEGRKLLAHELTHTLQQNTSYSPVQIRPTMTSKLVSVDNAADNSFIGMASKVPLPNQAQTTESGSSTTPSVQARSSTQKVPAPLTEFEEQEQEEFHSPGLTAQSPITPQAPRSIHNQGAGWFDLPVKERPFSEARFGVDFGSVRIQRDSRAIDATSSTLMRKPDVKPCGSRLKTVIGVLTTAVERVHAAISRLTELETGSVDSNLSQAFEQLFIPLDAGINQSIRDVRSTLTAMKSKLEQTVLGSERFVSCESVSDACENVLAFVEPPDDSVIFLCPSFFSLKDKETQVIVAIHEAAHMVLDEEPDVYRFSRLFRLLQGFSARPGIRNPDSLAIFASVAAKGISLAKGLKKLPKPPQDTLNGFSSNEELFVRRTLGLADTSILAAFKSVGSVKEKLKEPGAMTPGTKVKLAELVVKKVITSLGFKDVVDDKKAAEVKSRVLAERTISGRQLKLSAVRSLLDKLFDNLGRAVRLKREAGGNSPGIQVASDGSIKVFDDFFPKSVRRVPPPPDLHGASPLYQEVNVAPPPESRSGIQEASKHLVLELSKAIRNSGLNDDELNANSEYISGFVEKNIGELFGPAPT